jgi:hypothetical protein
MLLTLIKVTKVNKNNTNLSLSSFCHFFSYNAHARKLFSVSRFYKLRMLGNFRMYVRFLLDQALDSDQNTVLRVRCVRLGTTVLICRNSVLISYNMIWFEITTVYLGTCDLSPHSIPSPHMVGEMTIKCPNINACSIALSLSLSHNKSLVENSILQQFNTKRIGVRWTVGIPLYMYM